MCFPIESYGNSVIFCIFSGLKFYVLQFVGIDNRIFLFGDTDHFAFIWIKFHGPIIFPFLKFKQVILQDFMV